jgi:Flp pilus assembly pilin Flp
LEVFGRDPKRTPRIRGFSSRFFGEGVNDVSNLFEAMRREDGQSMAEYAVVLAVITIAVFGALALLSGNIVGAITRIAGYIT